jgi:Ca2+-binding RTX toxin-like protein
LVGNRNADDVLTGYAGNDELYGLSGDDEYVFARGDGNDVIIENDGGIANNQSGGIDHVTFGPGIDLANITVTQTNGGQNLLLTLDNGGGSVELYRTMTAAAYRVESLWLTSGVVTHAELVALSTVATSGDDHFWGSYDGESISGGAGFDWIDGRGGNDILAGGTGNDWLFGGSGDDTYVFGRGDAVDTVSDYVDWNVGAGGFDTVAFAPGIAPGDIIVTRSQDDFLLFLDGGEEYVFLVNSAGTDSLYQIEQVTFASAPAWSRDELFARIVPVSNLDNILAGTAGVDSLRGLGGDDLLQGLDGADRLRGDGGDDVLQGGAGNDVLEGGDGNDTLQSGDGQDTLNGGKGSDILAGGTGNDWLYGSSGDDTYVFGRGDAVDTISDYVDWNVGASGFDTVAFASGIAPGDIIVARSQDDFLLFLDGGEEYVFLVNAAGTDSLYQIEQVTFDGAPAWSRDDLFARIVPVSNLDNIWTGTAGVDSLRGLGGDDLLQGLDGADRLRGDDGNDVLEGGAGNDALEGGSGNDTLQGGDGDDTLDGGAGADAMAGGTGNDIYTVDAASDAVTEAAGEGTADEVRTGLVSYVLPAFVEKLTYTGAPATTGLTDNGLNNIVTGGAAADLIVLTGGEDLVYSGGGDDLLYFGASFSAGDVVDGGTGSDAVALGGTYNLTFGAGALTSVERLTLYGGSVIGTGPTSYQLTTVDANVGAGQLLSVSANTLGSGEQLIFNGLAETNGGIFIVSGAAADILVGGQMVDTIEGGAGNDQIYGQNGADFLTGGAGADILRGGLDGDKFIYKAVSDSTPGSYDQIQDFQAGSDRVDLSAIDSDANAANGNGAFSFIGTGAFSALGAASAGQLRVVQGTGGVWWAEGDTNGDGVADLLISMTYGSSTVTPLASHFIL